MDVVARRAEPADLEALSALRRASREEASRHRGGSLLNRSDLATPSGGGEPLLAVATIDGVVVGYAEACSEQLEGGSFLGSVTALYVDPPAREVGVGEALIDFVTAWATELGAEGVDAIVLPGAREAKNFFESSGFVARLITMHRRLTDEPAS